MNSTGWVLTVLHERFHQFRMDDPSYTQAVEPLDFAGGDQSGMRMRSEPFPYQSEAVADPFEALSRDLSRLFDHSSKAAWRTRWDRSFAFRGRQRASVCAFGAGLALPLDVEVPNWKRRSLRERCALEGHLATRSRPINGARTGL